MSEQVIDEQEHFAEAEKNNISASLITPLISDLKSSASDIVDSSSAEGLHLIRVTLRKIRAWIGVNKKQLTPSQIEDIKTNVRWISDITGPARDADVQLAKNARVETKLPKSAKTKLKQQQQDQYKIISTGLQSERFLAFTTLLTDITEGISLNDHLTPEHIRERVIKLVKKSLKQGNELQEGSADEEFHAVRKLLKKLRYTLGFLTQFSQDKKLTKTEKSLRQIQEYLGTFQDQTVLATELESRSAELMQDEAHDLQELFDLGVSLGETKSHIQNLKSGFAKAYGKFSKSVTKNLLGE